MCFARRAPASRATPMMSCTTRLRSAPKVAPVPRKPFIEEKSTCYSSVPPRYLWFLIAGKLFRPNIVFIYAYLTERATRRRDHWWRSSYVIDRTSQDSYMGEKHFRANVPSLPLPTVTIGHAREGRNKAEPWICTL